VFLAHQGEEGQYKARHGPGRRRAAAQTRGGVRRRGHWLGGVVVMCDARGLGE
jgi:hypothetical protein